MTGRLTAAGGQHHPARFSPQVVAYLRDLLAEIGPDARPVDPFAGTGEKWDEILPLGGWTGIEIEPEWASMHPRIRQGDALDPLAYPAGMALGVTSPTYGNRMADIYLGPTCPACDGRGHRFVPDGWHEGQEVEVCDRCHGVGKDPTGRHNYAISLGRKPSKRSSATLHYGATYQLFHETWLRLMAFLLPAGPRRLVLNVSDFNAALERVTAVDWWISAAQHAGFWVEFADRVPTPRLTHNHRRPGLAPEVEHETVVVCGLKAQRATWVGADGAPWVRSTTGALEQLRTEVPEA